MSRNKFTEAPPQCQLHHACRGYCESPREVKEELCQPCLEIKDSRFSGAQGDPWHFGYTNYKGEFSQRRATPVRFEFDSTEHHPEKQWIMFAIDHDKGAMRAFALADVVLGSGATRINQLEGIVADLVASDAGQVKEENDKIRLEAGGMAVEIAELRSALKEMTEAAQDCANTLYCQSSEGADALEAFRKAQTLSEQLLAVK